MQDLTQRIAELPWAAMLPVGLLFLVGLVLWATGRRVLRTVFAAAGLLTGIVVGLALSEHERVASLNIPTWAVTVAAALLLAIVAAAAYRLVLAASVAALLGLVAPLGVFTAAEMGAVTIEQGEMIVQPPLPAGEPDWWQDVLEHGAETPQVAEIDEALEALGAAVVETSETETEQQLPLWRRWTERARTVAVDVTTGVWDRSPQPLRWIMAASMAVGLLLGLFLGAAAPSMSAAILTALSGSLLLIGTSWTVVTRAGWTADWMPSSTPQWLAWWLIAAVIGLGVQWMFRAKRADKSAS